MGFSFPTFALTVCVCMCGVNVCVCVCVCVDVWVFVCILWCVWDAVMYLYRLAVYHRATNIKGRLQSGQRSIVSSTHC